MTDDLDLRMKIATSEAKRFHRRYFGKLGALTVDDLAQEAALIAWESERSGALLRLSMRDKLGRICGKERRHRHADINAQQHADPIGPLPISAWLPGLPAGEQQVLALLYAGGRSQQQTARALGITQQQVSAIKTSAIGRIREFEKINPVKTVTRGSR